MVNQINTICVNIIAILLIGTWYIDNIRSEKYHRYTTYIMTIIELYINNTFIGIYLSIILFILIKYYIYIMAFFILSKFLGLSCRQFSILKMPRGARRWPALKAAVQKKLTIRKTKILRINL